jgi:hypothetical protein
MGKYKIIKEIGNALLKSDFICCQMGKNIFHREDHPIVTSNQSCIINSG